jgi:hypothetical protein
MARHGGACLSVCTDLVAFCEVTRFRTTFAIVGEQSPKDSNPGIGPVTMTNRGPVQKRFRIGTGKSACRK